MARKRLVSPDEATSLTQNALATEQNHPRSNHASNITVDHSQHVRVCCPVWPDIQ